MTIFKLRQTALFLAKATTLLLTCQIYALADDYKLSVLKISPQDERAVIKTADGKAQVIKPGDGLDAKTLSVQSSKFAGKEKQEKNSTVLTVIEIAEGRVVLEERQGNDKETIIIRLKDGKQTVELIRKTPPSKLQQQIKAISSQPSATGKSKSDQKSSIN